VRAASRASSSCRLARLDAREKFRLRALRLVLPAFLLVTVYWLLIPASNDRDWMPEDIRARHCDVRRRRGHDPDVRDSVPSGFDSRRAGGGPSACRRRDDLAPLQLGIADVST
jgi:hypothetical protein